MERPFIINNISYPDIEKYLYYKLKEIRSFILVFEDNNITLSDIGNKIDNDFLDKFSKVWFLYGNKFYTLKYPEAMLFLTNIMDKLYDKNDKDKMNDIKKMIFTFEYVIDEYALNILKDYIISKGDNSLELITTEFIDFIVQNNLKY